jgi:pilus assembly protein Flp/PilA
MLFIKANRRGLFIKANRRGLFIKANRRGQGMTEYIIIVALIAIAAIGVVSLFGDNIRALFASSSNALAGEEAASAETAVAHQKLYGHKNMMYFGQRNDPA